MKKHTYVLGFLSAMLLIVLTSGNRIDSKAFYNDNYKKELQSISELVDVKSFVSTYELADSYLDDDEVIFYPSGIKEVPKKESNFKVSEFIVYDQNATELTRYKIKTIHIPQLDKVRDEIGKAIVIRSAARSYEHEKKMGRSGNSQHVYKTGSGAVDISVNDYSVDKLNMLEKAVMEKTNYTRVARYPSFLHLDYADNRYGDRGYYRNTKKGWIYIGEIKS